MTVDVVRDETRPPPITRVVFEWTPRPGITHWICADHQGEFIMGSRYSNDGDPEATTYVDVPPAELAEWCHRVIDMIEGEPL